MKTKCRICGREVHVESMDGPLSKMIEGLINIVACSRCHDLRIMHDKAVKDIRSACLTWKTACEAGPATKSRWAGEVGRQLKEGLKAYCRWVNLTYPKANAMMTDKLMSQFLEEPAEFRELLYKIRKPDA